MITLTRLSGTKFVLNADMIERIDATPDTVVTLADGTKYIVSDSLAEVVAAVRQFRAEIVALSWQVSPEQEPVPTSSSRLAPVTSLPASKSAGTPDHEES